MNGIKTYYLICHHDGHCNSKSTTRKTKGQSSNKINSTCTAQMVVSEQIGSSVVLFVTHLHIVITILISVVALDERRTSFHCRLVLMSRLFYSIIDKCLIQFLDLHCDCVISAKQKSRKLFPLIRYSTKFVIQ